MNKKLITAIIVSLSFISLCVYFFYETFYQYQPDVDKILAEISAEDKELPPTVLKVLRNTKQINDINNFAAGNILINLNEKKIHLSKFSWHLYKFVWLWALPIRIGEKEIFGFYINKVYFEKDKEDNEINGFRKASIFYFNKDLQLLNEEEVLTLLVYSKSPRLSRNRNSDLFTKEFDKFSRIYYANSDK